MSAFEEWWEDNDPNTILKTEWQEKIAQGAWNAALDNALKAVENSKKEMINEYDEGFVDGISQAMDTIEAGKV